MATSLKIAPPNSLVLVSDTRNAEIPVTMFDSRFAATDSCVAVGCLADVDGDTTFTLGLTSEVDPGTSPSFVRTIQTPNRLVSISTILGNSILETKVTKTHTTLKIWVNDDTEPDQVIVGFD